MSELKQNLLEGVPYYGMDEGGGVAQRAGRERGSS